MDLKRFKQLHKIYSKLQLPREVYETPEHDKYLNALHDDKECGEWYKKYYIKEAGINYKKYCCADMAYHLIEDKLANKKGEIDYDSVMKYDKSHKSFGIPIHDGGSSYIAIRFCPWCGKKLRK